MLNPKLKPNFDEIVKIYKFTDFSEPVKPNEQVHGFLVKSTAPINVEDENDENIDPDISVKKPRPSNISEVAEILKEEITKASVNVEAPEVIVRIHGYSTKEKNVIEQYHRIIQEINTYKEKHNIDKTFVFLGYRWPSESGGTGFRYIFDALPTLLRTIFLTSLIGIGFFLVVLLFQIFENIPLIFLLSGFGLFGLLLSITFTLVLLRISAYFRDSFRATNYGVPDLVELIRELDEAIKRDPDKPQIKLSFIAHSMGCYVTTNTIRILSDVFTSSNNPGPEIGNSFTLGRLILVAPDIPVETIKPRRANFLQASLKRFEESYIFSNEGDVVLRIASTAANYFSFPAKTRSSGYRLGNITVSRPHKTIQYGIINDSKPPYELLEVRSSDKQGDIIPIKDIKNADVEICKAVTNKFTYFDCTDYVDAKDGRRVTPVSLALKKKALNFWDYFRLILADLFSPDTNTHGGYFRGDFTKDLIYKLAFLGFDGLLDSYSSPGDSDDQRREKFSKECEDKQIMVLLSPER